MVAYHDRWFLDFFRRSYGRVRVPKLTQIMSPEDLKDKDKDKPWVETNTGPRGPPPDEAFDVAERSRLPGESECDTAAPYRHKVLSGPPFSDLLCGQNWVFPTVCSDMICCFCESPWQLYPVRHGILSQFQYITALPEFIPNKFFCGCPLAADVRGQVAAPAGGLPGGTPPKTIKEQVNAQKTPGGEENKGEPAETADEIKGKIKKASHHEA